MQRPNIVVLVGNHEHLWSWLKQQVARTAYIFPDHYMNGGSCVLSEDPNISSWADFDAPLGGWYQTHAPYNTFPVIDIRTGEGQNQLLEAIVNPASVSPPPTQSPEGNAIIITGGQQGLVEQVERMALRAGYRFISGPHRRSSALRLSRGTPSGWDTSTNPFPAHRPEYIAAHYPLRLDARTQWAQVMTFFASQTEPVKLLSTELVQLINGTPTSELIAGFIRRDFGLVLPPEVQTKGSKAILDWFTAQMPKPPPPVAVAAPAPAPENPPPPPTPARPTHHRFTVDMQFTESWMEPNYRDITRTYAGMVPDDVVQRALEVEDNAMIEEWLEEHRTELELLHETSDEPYVGDSRNHEEVYGGIEYDGQSPPIQEQLEQISEHQNTTTNETA